MQSSLTIVNEVLERFVVVDVLTLAAAAAAAAAACIPPGCLSQLSKPTLHRGIQFNVAPASVAALIIMQSSSSYPFRRCSHNMQS